MEIKTTFIAKILGQSSECVPDNKHLTNPPQLFQHLFHKIGPWPPVIVPDKSMHIKTDEIAQRRKRSLSHLCVTRCYEI